MLFTKPGSQFSSKLSALISIEWTFLRVVKIIVQITRNDMQMIMPDILVSSGFIVLSKHDPITAIFRLHCQRDFPAQRMNFHGNIHWQVIDVFKMQVGNDQHMSLILWIPPRCDKSRYISCLENDIRLS